MTTISNKARYYASTMNEAPALVGAPGSLVALLDACLVDGFDTKTINTLVISDGIALANISSGHYFAEGDVIRIAGATPSELNNDWRIASSTADTATFSVEGIGIADGSASGTITCRRAPAGWEKLFSGTNRAAYRSLSCADHNGLILYVSDTGTTTARVRGYESMADIDTGEGPFPTDAQSSGGLWWAKAEAADVTRQWRIVADDRRLVVVPFYVNGVPESAPSYIFGKTTLAGTEDIWSTMISGPTTSANALQTLPGGGAAQGTLPYTTGAISNAAWMARATSGAPGSAIAPVRCLGSAVTGSSSYSSADPATDVLFGERVRLYSGTGVTADRPRAVAPAVMHLQVNPSGSRPRVVGVPGNGALLLSAGTATGAAYLVSLGENGSLE